MIRIFNQYISPRALVLLPVEGAVILLSLLCSVKLAFWNDTVFAEQPLGPPNFLIRAFGFLILVQVSFYFNNLYDLGGLSFRRAKTSRVGGAVLAAGILFGILQALLPGPDFGGRMFVGALALTAASVKLVRGALEKAWPAAAAQNLLIVGTGDLAQAVARELAKRADLSAKLAGFVGEEPGPHSCWPAKFKVLGSYDELESLVFARGVSRIIVALEDWRGALPTKQLMAVRVSGVAVEDAHTVLAGLTGRVWLQAIRPSWLTLFVFSGGFNRSRLIAILKRATDLCFGLLGLILTAPIMLAAAAAILIETGQPIIYRQVRVGLRGQRFHLLKLRSMGVDAEANGKAQWAQENDPRVTCVGRFLRKFRIDELPQFINVIRGEMSFVGPRPERPEFVETLRQQFPYYDFRHTVRPGITGWAQIRYAYAASVEDSIRKLEYDFFYLKHMSIPYDCAIAFRTLGIVLFGRGSR